MKNKSLFALCIILATALVLCACGAAGQPGSQSTPAASKADASVSAPAASQQPEEQTPAASQPEEQSPADSQEQEGQAPATSQEQQADASSDPNFYSVATSLSKADVEDFASKVRQAYLDRDWTTLSTMIRYPITMYPDVQVNNAEEFLAYTEGKVVTDEDAKLMEDETCTDMFANSQGVSMGSGLIWLGEVDDNGTAVMKIISLSGLTDE